jgi:hypothetical protein
MNTSTCKVISSTPLLHLGPHPAPNCGLPAADAAAATPPWRLPGVRDILSRIVILHEFTIAEIEIKRKPTDTVAKKKKRSVCEAHRKRSNGCKNAAKRRRSGYRLAWGVKKAERGEKDEVGERIRLRGRKGNGAAAMHHCGAGGCGGSRRDRLSSSPSVCRWLWRVRTASGGSGGNEVVVVVEAAQRDWRPHLRRPNLIQWLQMFLPYETLVQALEHTSQWFRLARNHWTSIKKNWNFKNLNIRNSNKST